MFSTSCNINSYNTGIFRANGVFQENLSDQCHKLPSDKTILNDTVRILCSLHSKKCYCCAIRSTVMNLVHANLYVIERISAFLVQKIDC